MFAAHTKTKAKMANLKTVDPMCRAGMPTRSSIQSDLKRYSTLESVNNKSTSKITNQPTASFEMSKSYYHHDVYFKAEVRKKFFCGVIDDYLGSNETVGGVSEWNANTRKLQSSKSYRVKTEGTRSSHTNFQARANQTVNQSRVKTAYRQQSAPIITVTAKHNSKLYGQKFKQKRQRPENRKMGIHKQKEPHPDDKDDKDKDKEEKELSVILQMKVQSAEKQRHVEIEKYNPQIFNFHSSSNSSLISNSKQSELELYNEDENQEERENNRIFVNSEKFIKNILSNQYWQVDQYYCQKSRKKVNMLKFKYPEPEPHLSSFAFEEASHCPESNIQRRQHIEKCDRMIKIMNKIEDIKLPAIWSLYSKEHSLYSSPHIKSLREQLFVFRQQNNKLQILTTRRYGSLFHQYCEEIVDIIASLVKVVKSSAASQLLCNSICMENIYKVNEKDYRIGDWMCSALSNRIELGQGRRDRKTVILRGQPILMDGCGWLLTPEVLAPQIINSLLINDGRFDSVWQSMEQSNHNPEIWSIGIVLLQLLYVIPVWLSEQARISHNLPKRGLLCSSRHGMNHRSKLQDIAKQQAKLQMTINKWLRQQISKPPLKYVPTYLLELLKRMLAIRAADRIKIQQILQILNR